MTQRHTFGFVLPVSLALVSAMGVAGLSLFAQVAGDNNRGADLSPKPPVQPKTAAELVRVTRTTAATSWMIQTLRIYRTPTPPLAR